MIGKSERQVSLFMEQNTEFVASLHAERQRLKADRLLDGYAPFLTHADKRYIGLVRFEYYNSYFTPS